MTDNMKYKNDLKIVVDNTNINKESDNNEILIIESGDLGEDMDHNNNNNQLNILSNNDLHQTVSIEMNSETEETEFHVNLDKVPLSLKNTVLGSKMYINESFEKEKIDDIKTINETDLKSLYESLDIDDNSFVESSYNINYYRKEALHIIGVDDMSTNDIFEYFGPYKPYSIEWISDNLCNVVWKDDYLTTLALIDLTKPYIDENLEKLNGVSNNLENKEIIKDDKVEGMDDSVENNDDDELDAVDDHVHYKKASLLLPPGKWRIGLEAKNGNHLFIRYAKLDDKKVKGAEARSKYYVKHGNPNYGFMKGLISSSKRNKLKTNLYNRFINYDVETNNDDDDVFENNLDQREIMSRVGKSNDDRSLRNGHDKNGKSQRKMRMYIDDYDDESSKRKRRNDDDSDDSDEEDKDSHRQKVIRKPLDARSYLKMKDSKSKSNNENSDKRLKVDLRDKLNKRHKR